MSSPRFRVGDKVVINKKSPLWILESVRRSRPRTIIDRRYVPRFNYCLYFLGSNKIGDDISQRGFRAYELSPARGSSTKGRPREKRKYSRVKGVRV